MQSKIMALPRTSRLAWALTALALVGGALFAASAGAAVHQRQGVATSWDTYHPRGWSAGSVARGTGYHRPGASLRVRDVQRRLDRLGYRAGKVDGFFGPITDAAVRGYQRNRALVADGIVGPRTLSDLHARTGRVETSAGGRAAGRNPGNASASTSRPGGGSSLEPAALAAGGLAMLLLLAGLVLLARRPVTRAVDRMRQRMGWLRGTPSDPRTLFVEGRSADQRIGAFSGFAYTIWPVASDGGEETLSLLVYDPTKPKPVSARLSEITTVNGQVLEHESSDQTEVTPEQVDKPLRWRPQSQDSATGKRALRIVRRIDTLPIGDVPRAGHPEANRFLWFGARVHPGRTPGIATLPGTLFVELELFAETRHSRWETELLKTGGPYQISIGDFEASVRAIVVPTCIPRLVEALADVAVIVDADELERLPFAVERTIEVERAIAESEVLRLRAS